MTRWVHEPAQGRFGSSRGTRQMRPARALLMSHPYSLLHVNFSQTVHLVRTARVQQLKNRDVRLGLESSCLLRVRPTSAGPREISPTHFFIRRSLPLDCSSHAIP